MSYDRVRLRMGVEGVKKLIHTPGSGVTTSVEYPGPPFDVCVQYDHRIDRRPAAHVVLLRASMELTPASVQALVDRFGRPDTGAEDLEEGLDHGAAVWIDEACGVVLTAYRPVAVWWTAEGGPTFQVEALDLARKGGSPGSAIVNAMLTKENAPAPVPSQTVPVLTPESEASAGAIDGISPPPVVARIDLPTADAVAPPPSPPRAIGQRIPQTIATWRPTAPSLSAAPSDRNGPAPQRRPARGDALAPSDRPAERVTFVPPVYPPTAKWSGVKGHVTLAIVVRADGTVAHRPRVVAARPAGRGFEEAAAEAALKWRFSPAIRRGQPVESTLTIGVEFE
jgi:periplasmic protein TonB